MDKPLFPIRRAPGNYTVVFMRYIDDPGNDLYAVRLANELASRYHNEGHEVYVVKARSAAYICLGSFNEPEGNEAKRALEVAGRLIPESKIEPQERVVTSTGPRVSRRTLVLEPKVVAIDYLKGLEELKPGEAVITVIKEEKPER
jgi:hypothetical protein